MARLIGFTYGELRGKIGGNVFSRNKAGAYVRARVTPVNPQTVRQQTARYRFGNMSILYQSLANNVKDCWETFARTHFNPLKGNNTGIYTGGNAFVGLRQSAGQGNQYRSTPTGLSNATNVVFTAVAYDEVSEPPTTPLGAIMVDNSGLEREFNIGEIGITNDKIIEFSITIPSGATNPTATIDNFSDATGNAFGISFYLSNTLKFEGSKPNTALKINAFDTGVIQNIEVGTTNAGFKVSEGVQMQIEANFDESDTRDFPCAGDVILVTPVLRSNSGAQKLMAPQYVTVSAAA